LHLRLGCGRNYHPAFLVCNDIEQLRHIAKLPVIMQIPLKLANGSKAKLFDSSRRKRLYQWTAIDEFSRYRFVYGFEEHTPENSVKFLKLLEAAFPFKIGAVQTDNGTEFTYRYISEEKECPFETALREAGIEHRLIPPRTPWHNGKVERSHRNDQRYFYDWERFGDVDELNHKLREHLEWSNRKPMRTLGGKSPMQRLHEALAV